MIIGVDIGLDGGISYYKNIKMPSVNKIVKKEVKVFNLLKNKKQIYKTGKRKGEFKYKIKTPAKYKKELDLKTISDIFIKESTVVFELPGITIGNAASSSRTVERNFGKLLAIAEINKCKIVTVSANKWKKDLGLGRDKRDSVNLAEKLSGESFKTKRGALIDGPAEAYLIKYWYNKKGK